ncbi:hypothetical protein V5O48_010481 [Marasmius crinis-equi]|uniref:Uncharacterized protein n=1 Tax=Marasmius crinis-equi TaxID=585013 RepID=A0ABR3F892_9AGAR
MELAESIGINAFTLNIGKDPFTDAQLKYAYNSANGMKGFISFDCADFRQGDEYAIGGKIAHLGSATNLVFVSTFEEDGLNFVAIRSAAMNHIYNAPDFHPGMGSFGGLDGEFSWAAWSSKGRNKALTELGNTASVDSLERSYISALGGSIARRKMEDGNDGTSRSAGSDGGRSGDVEDSVAHGDAKGVVDVSLNWIPDIMASGEDVNSTVAAAAAGSKGYIAPCIHCDHHSERVGRISLHQTPLLKADGRWLYLGWAYLFKPFIAAYKASSPSVNPYITSD